MGSLAPAAKLAHGLRTHGMLMLSKANRQALFAVLIYIITAGVWILFSDRLVKSLSANQDLWVRLSIFKDWIFVLATGGLLYLVLRRQLKAWEQAVAERKQIEIELEKARTYYRNLLATSSDGIHLLRANGELLEANPAFYQMLGYDPENPPTLKVTDWNVIWPEAELLRRIHDLIESPALFEMVHRRRDGRDIYVEISARSIEVNGERCLFASSRDITARQQVIDQLRETTAQLLEAQQVAGLGSYVFDVTTGLWTGSDILGGILGVANPNTPRPIEAWEQVVHPRDREEMRRYFQEEVLKKRLPFDRIYRIVRAGDQQERWVHGLGKLIQDDHGQVTRLVGVIQDVTEQRQLERRVQQAQKLEAIGTLAGGIAHDFNNILASMFGYVYLLQQDTLGNAGAQESLDEILKATARAKDLVQQILMFSRQHEQKPQVIQLESVVKEVVKFLRASLPSQIKIELRVAPDAPPVLADPTQIYQVAINLATNALHAMEGRSGQLTVSVESFLPAARYLQLHPEFRPVPYVLLVLADTGHGMEAKTRERIFEPFFTTKPIGKGTGLGLSVVHGIVQSHHGVITVESELGIGTTFKVYFPGQPANAAPAVAAENVVAMGRGERILLLDDEPALTGALRRLLARLNYQVTVSNSAREVLDWCGQDASQFDLVITDLTMPEMTGLEVARQLHTLRPALPVILSSGFCADLSPETLAAAGIVELLEKPVTRQGLAGAVRRVLDRPPPAGAPPPV